MRTSNAVVAVVILSLFAACPQPSGLDAGTGGGTGGATGGGGGVTSGGGAGGGGGGGSTGGGSAGGGSGIDAGLPSCTFEAPFDLGPTDPNANFTSAVAMTASGEAIYVWNDGQSVRWRVQSPAGVLGPELVDVDAGSVPSVHAVAAGDRALLAYATAQGSLFETRTHRYSSAGGWEAMQKVLPDSATAGVPTLAIERDGAASLWRQDGFGTSPIVEYSSTGAGPIANPHQVASGGFMYGATRNGGVRLAITLAATSVPPVALFTDGSGDVTVPLPGAQYNGNDLYHAAIADDGTAVVGGQFALNGLVVVGAVTREGGVTSPVQALSTFTDAGFDAHQMIGVLAGAGGQGLVVWLDLPALSIWAAHRPAGGTWGAPRLVAFSNGVIPRFSKLSSTRGLVHYYTPTGAQRVELNVDGFVGAPVMSNDFPGAVFGVEYAAGHGHAAAIKSTPAGDGGWVARAAQCR